MKYYIGEYLEIFNPAQNNFFQVRIIEVLEQVIKVKIIKTDKERLFSYYYMENYPSYEPIITHDLLKKCGFENKNESLIWKKSNIVILQCIINKEHNDFLKNKIDFYSRYLGFKIVKEENLTEFLKVLKNTKHNCDMDKFEKKNNTIRKAIDLFKELEKYSINDFDTDKIIVR